MSKVSQFAQLPFPIQSTNFPTVGEKKCAHNLVSRVLWDGAPQEGTGVNPVINFMAATQAGSYIIPANFFNTYNSLEFNAFIDVTGMTNYQYSGSGSMFWGLTVGGEITEYGEEFGFTFPEFAPPDTGDQTMEFICRLVRYNNTIVSYLRFIMGKDDFDAKIYQGQRAGIAFDGSVAGVGPTIPLYCQFRLQYSGPPAVDYPQQPVSLYSRLTY
jgi:hypothetical protein